MKSFASIVAFLTVVISLSGCSEKQPAALWPPAPNTVPSPQITGLNPPDTAGPGVLDIAINGENFGTSPSQLFVYFGTSLVNVTSVTPTQITLPRPTVYGDSITVKVVVQDADLEAKYPNYVVTQVAKSLGGFVPLSVTSAEASDDSGNVYVAIDNSKTIVKVTPDGTMMDYAAYSRTLTIASMRMGSDGTLYIQMAFKKDLYTIPPGGGALTKLLSFSDAMNVFDFDQNGNIYAGGSNKHLNIAHTDNSIATGPDYSGYNVIAVRVYDNYLYVLAQNTSSDSTMPSGVFRHQITSANGDLGARELVLDWSTTGDYSASRFNDLTFSSDGYMYIATDNANPILMVSPSGSMRPLYKGILTPTAAAITWSGSTLYQLMGGDQIGLTSIAMGKSGAPYFGR